MLIFVWSHGGLSRSRTLEICVARSLLPDANFAPAAAGEHHRIAFSLRDLS